MDIMIIMGHRQISIKKNNNIIGTISIEEIQMIDPINIIISINTGLNKKIIIDIIIYKVNKKYKIHKNYMIVKHFITQA